MFIYTLNITNKKLKLFINLNLLLFVTFNIHSQGLSMTNFPLKNILLTFSNSAGQKRLIFNQAPIGGISSFTIIIFIISLPFIEFALIFNSYIFNKLGIATCIVSYIVFLSLIMIIVFLLIWIIKKRTIKKIEPTWNEYFADININAVLSSGITPYSKFFEYYSQAIKTNVKDEDLHNYLKKSFEIMQDENKDLIEALKRDNRLK